MSLILSIETSGAVCSVAMHLEGQVEAVKEVHISQAHASQTALLIQDVLKFAGRSTKDIKAIAVSSGPGSYTGLRIGTSTAKGLCYALNLPLISVGTLELLTKRGLEIKESEEWVCPMIDARRMEVYCMLSDSSGRMIQSVEAKVLDNSSFTEYLNKQRILFYGDGAKKFSEILEHNNARFMDGIYASASTLGELAYNKWESEQIEDLINFEPYYLKEFQFKQPKIST
jgi:tRNA threonylcarbamoyladenosine biosynthesis protein TsaB